MNIEKIKILSHKFQVIQKFQLPKISGICIYWIKCLRCIIVSYNTYITMKHFKISEIFWIFDMEVFGKEIF